MLLRTKIGVISRKNNCPRVDAEYFLIPDHMVAQFEHTVTNNCTDYKKEQNLHKLKPVLTVLQITECE
jgi:hypothetical protein